MKSAVSVSRFLVATSLLLIGVTAVRMPASAGGVSEGGISSDNVEWVGNLRPLIGSATGSGRHGDFIYMTDEVRLYVIDASEPLTPRVRSSLVLGGVVPNDTRIATNGRIAVFPVDTSEHASKDQLGITVVDLRDKDDPRILATVGGDPGRPDVSWTCVLGCRWVYGAYSGRIIDLRDPASPRMLTRRWNARLRFDPQPLEQFESDRVYWPDTRTLDEPRPGIVVTASHPLYVLDARHDPTRPRVIHRSDGAPYSNLDVTWPSRGKSRFVLASSLLSSTFHQTCERVGSQDGNTFTTAFATWDTHPARHGGLLRVADTYRVRNGTMTDGDPPISLGGCVAGWFEPHPRFHATGLVGMNALTNGVKFLRVDERGRIHKFGWFLPHVGSPYDGYWVADDVWYSLDWDGVIDVLKVKRIEQ